MPVWQYCRTGPKTGTYNKSFRVASGRNILQLFLVNIYGISGGIAEFRNTSIAYLAYKSASLLTLRSIFMFLQGPEHFTV